MKKAWKMKIAAISAVLAMAQTSHAVLTSDTLSDLIAGGSIGVGDKIFSGFTASESGLDAGFASQINVSATVQPDGTYYLTYSGAGLTYSTLFAAVSPTQDSMADLTLGYTVTATAGKIYAIDQAYTAGITGTGALNIDETVTSASATAFSHLSGGASGTDVSDPNNFPSGNFSEIDIVGTPDQLLINPAESTVHVTKDISYEIEGHGKIALSVVAQSFHQTAVPETTTIIAASLLLLPFGASTLKIVRKNRAA